MAKTRGLRIFRTRTAATAVGATLLAGLGVGLTAPSAQAAKSDCYAGAFCAYTQSNHAGTPAKVYQNNTDLTMYASFAKPKSLYNRGNSCDVIMYTGKNYSGNQMLVERGDAFNVSADSTFRKNGIGSNKWVNCS